MKKLFFQPVILAACLLWLHPCDVTAQRQETQELDTEATLEIGQWAFKADEAAKKGEYRDAIGFYSKIVKKYPKFSNRVLLHRADCYFSDGQIQKAIQDYDALIELDSKIKPYLWQRGLALYYADEFKKGWLQFESHQKVNTQDVENAAWHFLCLARKKGVTHARKKLIPIDADTRIPMKQVHQMFAGELKVEDVINVARKQNSKSGIYYAYLYAGLYLEAKGENKKAIEMMQLAAKKIPFESDVLMGQIANIHLALRKKQAQERQKDE